MNNLPREFLAQPGNTQTFTVDGLVSGRAYAVQVAAVDNFGREGEKSLPIAVATAANSGISSGALAGLVIGTLLAGFLIGTLTGFSITRTVTKRTLVRRIKNIRKEKAWR